MHREEISSARHGGYSRVRHRNQIHSDEEIVEIDEQQDVNDNLREIFIHIVRTDVHKSRKLAYLNAFVKYYTSIHNNPNIVFTHHEILCSLRCCLLHRYSVIRAAAIRALRYTIHRTEQVELFFIYKLDWAVARCLDLHYSYETERNQAIQLVRHLCHISPLSIQPSLILPFIAIVDDGGQDRAVHVSLQLLTELAFTNPALLKKTRGVHIIIQYIIESHEYSRVTESLLITVLHLLNQPHCRDLFGKDIHLDRLLAPFTDRYYSHKNDSSENNYNRKEQRALRCDACRHALVIALHSWPGLVSLSSIDSSAIPSLVSALQLTTCGSQKSLLTLLYQVFMLETPQWTDNFEEALLNYNRTCTNPKWSLREGFVAAECLHHLDDTAGRVNLIDNHLALLLCTFMDHHILETLCEVIVYSDSNTSIWATILLGELLYMSYHLLPWQDSEPTHFLPLLVSSSREESSTPEQKLQAHQAVTYLDRIHARKKKLDTFHSLHLETLISYHTPQSTQKTSSVNDIQQTIPETEESITSMIKDSMVMVESQPELYNWSLLYSILSAPAVTLAKIEEVMLNRFLSKLLVYYNPKSENGYSSVKLTNPISRIYSSVGLLLALRCIELKSLMELKEADRNLKEFMFDLCYCLSEIRSQEPVSDVRLGLSQIFHTCSQHYFLLIGKLSSTEDGLALLESMGIIQQLMDLVTITSNECYVKLIVSSLDYTRETPCRIILLKALTATSEEARLYTADFMRALLRLKVPFFSSWCMELLVKQLYDQSKLVALRALEVIDEACHDKANLISFITLNPSILHLGEYGTLLFSRYLSVTEGFHFLQKHGSLTAELERWHQTFNEVYVDVVDKKLAEALTTYERNLENNDVMRRSSLERPARRTAYLPPHLYGQLVQHESGAELISELPSLTELCNTLFYDTISDCVNIRQSKAALWALGHIGSSIYGLRILASRKIVPRIALVAEKAELLTIRGTAFYVLGLIASTQAGVAHLAECNWRSVMNRRSDAWPILTEQMISHDPEAVREIRSMSAGSSGRSERSDTDEGLRSRTSTDEEYAEIRRLRNESNLNKTAMLTSELDLLTKSGKAHSTSEIPMSRTPQHTRSSSDSVRNWRPEEYTVHENKISESYGIHDELHDELHDDLHGELHDEGEISPIELDPSDNEKTTPQKSSLRATKSIQKYIFQTTPEKSIEQRSQSVTKIRSLSWKNDVKLENSINTSYRTNSVSSHHSADSALSKSFSPRDDKTTEYTTLPADLSTTRSRKRLTSFSNNTAASSTFSRGSYSKRRDDYKAAAFRAIRRQLSVSSDQGINTLTTGSPQSTFNKSTLRTMSHQSDAATLTEVRKISDTTQPVIQYTDDRYMGLALPSDVHSLFQLPVDISPTSDTSMELTLRLPPAMLVMGGKGRRPSVISATHALELHSSTNCLLCQEIQVSKIDFTDDSLSPMSPEALEAEDEVPSVLTPLPSKFIERQTSKSSFNNQTDQNLTPAIQTNYKVGRNVLRKECIKFVTTISGMIGVNSAEEGLLRLREQFPDLFEDMCLYSEVCAILGTYSFHLPARRFIQELFQETNFQQVITKTQKSLKFHSGEVCCSKHLTAPDSSNNTEVQIIVHDDFTS